MASAMNLGVKAGRLAYLAGRMDKKNYATASSPLDQISKLIND
jgi:thiazole synthase